MRTPQLLCLLAALAAPTSAIACRDLPHEKKFAVAEVVVVGWLARASIPELEALSPGSSDIDAVERSFGSRQFRIVVTATQKGSPVATLDFSVDHCTGAHLSLGSRVIAYRLPGGKWVASNYSEQER